MSVDDHLMKMWDGAIEFEPVVDGTKVQAIKADVEASLSKFEGHREAILTILRNEHQREPKTDPFDENATWDRLARFAHSFLLQERVKQATMPDAELKAQLNELATALTRSRTLVEEMQDDVGDDLFSAWCEGTDEPSASVVSNGDGSFAMVRVPEQMFNKAVASLAALETAAVRAADGAREKRAGRGRPKGTKVLPTVHVLVLAARYRESTGTKPGAGRGPFVRFVFAFLSALDRANITEDYVVELVQNARSWARAHPNEGGLSPFDD